MSDATFDYDAMIDAMYAETDRRAPSFAEVDPDHSDEERRHLDAMAGWTAEDHADFEAMAEQGQILRDRDDARHPDD